MSEIIIMTNIENKRKLYMSLNDRGIFKLVAKIMCIEAVNANLMRIAHVHTQDSKTNCNHVTKFLIHHSCLTLSQQIVNTLQLYTVALYMMMHRV